MRACVRSCVRVRVPAHACACACVCALQEAWRAELLRNVDLVYAQWATADQVKHPYEYPMSTS